MPPHCEKKRAQIPHAPQSLTILFPEYLPTKFQGFPVEGQGLLELSFRLKDVSHIVHTYQSVDMLLTQSPSSLLQS